MRAQTGLLGAQVTCAVAQRRCKDQRVGQDPPGGLRHGENTMAYHGTRYHSFLHVEIGRELWCNGLRLTIRVDSSYNC